MAMKTANEQEYDKVSARATSTKTGAVMKGAGPAVGWSLTGILGTLAAIMLTPLTFGAFPVLALLAIGAAVLRGVGKSASAFSARSQLKQVEADLQADGEKLTSEKMGERLRDEPRGLFSGLMRAVKETIRPTQVRGEEQPRMRDWGHRYADRQQGMKGLDALGVSQELTADMQKFLAERIKFEKVGKGIDPMRFTLRLSAKEMNGEGVPPGLKEALEKLQAQHYRNFAEAYLPNHIAHRNALLEKEAKGTLSAEEQKEVNSLTEQEREEAKALAKMVAKSYEKQFGKVEEPEIGYHNGQNSVTFKPNSLQSLAANAMLSKAGQKPDIDDERLQGMRDVYAKGKAKDAGKGKANGPDAGSGKSKGREEHARS